MRKLFEFCDGLVLDLMDLRSSLSFGADFGLLSFVFYPASC